MSDLDYKYVESRLPDKLKKNKSCPNCNGKDFYIQTSNFLCFSFDKNGSIYKLNFDHNEWNNIEQTRCRNCGSVME